VQEDRERVKDIVAVVIDRSTSQTLGDRAQMTDRVRADLQRRFAGLPDVEPRFIEAGDTEGNDGTRCSRRSRTRSPTSRRIGSPAPSWSPTASSTTSRRTPPCSASGRRFMRWSPAVRTSATAASR
jgi:hypothetical protein